MRDHLPRLMPPRAPRSGLARHAALRHCRRCRVRVAAAPWLGARASAAAFATEQPPPHAARRSAPSPPRRSRAPALQGG
jgi:hypothetical protein